MKRPLLFAAVCSFLAAAGLHAADQGSSARAEVIFDHPEKFTDVTDRADPPDNDRDALLYAIRSYIVSQAKDYVPEGDKLTVTFADIDMAGAFEPWRGPEYNSVRVMKDIYPPHMKFTWSVTDPSGATVKDGKEDLLNQNYLMLISAPDPDDNLRYEKDMLHSWMGKALGGLKKESMSR